jgi:hypothetical protein
MLSLTDILGALFVTGFRSAPGILVGVVGLYLAISRRKRHPRVSRFAIIGFSSLLLIVFMWFVFELWLAYAVSQQIVRAGQTSEIATNLSLVTNIVNLIALSTICAAVFLDREAPPKLNGLPTHDQ